MTSQDFHDKFRQHNNHSHTIHFPQTISIHAKYFVSMKHKLVKICEGFSRIDSFSKMECTGRTRLMRQKYRPKRRAKITKLFF